MDPTSNIASFRPSNNIPLVRTGFVQGCLVSCSSIHSYLLASAQFSTITSREPNERILAKMLFHLKPVFEDKYNYPPATNNMD
jgi:hypothetical protein